jgi:hypothetical protein
VVLNKDPFAPNGDIWQCLETFFVVTIKAVGASGIQWVETRNAQDSTIQPKLLQLQMSTVPRSEKLEWLRILFLPKEN